MVKISWLKNLMLLAVLFCATTVLAEDLYNATVPVETRASTERTRALQVALNQVFVKVSGERTAARNADLDPALRQVNNIVTQYSYHEESSGELLLTASFDEEAVNLALVQANLSVWDGFRPVNIVWAVVDVNGRRHMLTQSEEQPRVIEIREELQAQAAMRGMNLIFPLGDLKDRQAVTSSDIWGGFNSRISKASQRYDSDGIMILKLTARGKDNYQIDWNAALGREQNSGYRNNMPLSAALSEPVNSMADISANMYATAFEQIDEATLIVTDLKEVQDYAQVYAYLKQLNTVNDVQLVEFASDNVVFNLRLSGRLATFERNLSLDGLLLPAGDPTVFAENNAVVYRYMP